MCRVLALPHSSLPRTGEVRRPGIRQQGQGSRLSRPDLAHASVDLSHRRLPISEVVNDGQVRMFELGMETRGGI